MIVANGSTDVTTYFVLRDSTNHAPKTDVTVTDIDLYYLEQGAAMAAKVDATALDAADSAHADNKGYHCGHGLYRIDWPDEAFNGGVGKRAYLIVVCTGVDTTFLEVELSPNVNTNSLTADVITAAGIADNAFANEHFANGALTSTEITSAAGCVVASIANDAITAAAIQNGAIDAATFAANAITSTVIADDAITAAKLNTGAITADAFAADAIVAATLATGAITADAFAADAIVAATLATGALTADAFAANAITNAAVADDVDVNVKTMTAGVITSTVLADDCITAAKLNTDAIAADAFAQTAADKVWGTAARVLTANTNLSILDAAATAAAVWDAVASSYDDASSMGALLNDAGAAGDPWATAIPGAYGAGTAGLLLGTTIPNAIDAVDNYVDTELAAVKTVVDAVKLKTDNIPASPAAVGSAMTISSGAITAGVFAAGAITADVIANAAIDQATFAADVYVTCDVKKVNGTTLTGDGGATPWGPA